MKVRKFPDALVVILAFFLLAGLLTYIVPSGQYERQYDPLTQREIVVPGSFATVDKDPLSPIGFAKALPMGITAAAEIIVLIILVGGALSVVEQSGAFRLGIDLLFTRLKGRRNAALVALAVVFLTGGIVEGLYEEIVPLVPVLTVFAVRFGFSPILIVAASLGPAVIGTAFSPINPFGAVLAQKIAGVPFLTGAGFNLALLALVFTVWLAMLMIYSRKARVQADPSVTPARADVTHKRIGVAVLLLVGVGFVAMANGLLMWEWGFNEISGEFFFLGIVVGLLSGMGVNGTVAAFIAGFREMIYPSLVVGFGYGISQAMKEGMIIDTIVYGLSLPLQYLSAAWSAWGMMLAQSLLHIVIPSYTGQAAITLPILIPLSDLIGLSRQVCILAFQSGAILMDMVVPTSGALMAVLAIAKVPYWEWLKFIAPRLLAVYVMAAIAVAVAVRLGV